MNPLLQPRLLDDHHNLPFGDVKNSDYAPAFEEAIRLARGRLDVIAQDPAPASFTNTIEAIEFHKEELDKISLLFFNLIGANTNDEMQAFAKEISPKLAEFANDLLLNPRIFARVKDVHERRNDMGLDTERLQLVEKTYKAFRRNGANLSESDKEKLREIDRQLARITQEFSDNVLKATNDYLLFVTDEAALKDLPKGTVEDAKNTAKEKGKPEAWAFTLHAPSYGPFLQFCSRDDLRREIWMAVMTKGMKAPFDNRENTRLLAKLRHDRASLLGYDSHAHFVLEERMAGSPAKVKAFLDELLSHSRPAAERDFEELKDAKKRHVGNDDLKPWDVSFYIERLQREKFKLSEEELRPYFSLENVIQGVFEHARRLYGITFRERKDIPVYHADVKAYEVRDEASGRFMAFFYADFFPRASKRGGAWMTNFLEQGTWDGRVCRPHVSIVCNFTKPSSTQPSLLTHGEVKTLFHEFGHALHSILSDCHYASISGTNVYWDFVELPSQVMENWAYEPEGLALFARHYQTGQNMPAEMIQKINDASTYMAGWMSLRQLSFSFLDMAWHSSDPGDNLDIESFERSHVQRALFFPPVAGTAMSTSFTHIFSGGYSAGYYSYKWAEVLDADAFEYFKEKGIFSSDVAHAFRANVLSRGGTEHPMDLYKRFRGREPDPKALLRRDGLIAEK
ncbi:MAG: M3 family metallopeptidase [Bdellovibrionota bacterium]